MKKKDYQNAAPGSDNQPEAAQNVTETQSNDAPETENAGQAPEATVEQWQKALETAVQQRDDYLDSLRRTQADFQNFKRRNQTARSDGYEDGTCDVLSAMLPFVDNLERALEAAAKADIQDGLVDGVKMTLQMFMEGMKRFGFEEVPALGEEFNPELHNAVMRESSEEPGKILEVYQKGYRVKDKIIRYAMVKVAVE